MVTFIYRLRLSRQAPAENPKNTGICGFREGSNWIDLAIPCRSVSFRGHQPGWPPVLGHGSEKFRNVLGSWRLAGWLKVSPNLSGHLRCSLILSAPHHQLRPEVPPRKKLRILDPWSLDARSLDPWSLDSIPAASNPRILEVLEGLQDRRVW